MEVHDVQEKATRYQREMVSEKVITAVSYKKFTEILV